MPRWPGAWPVLRDGAGGVVAAVESAGAYRFEAISTPNGAVVTASDPVVIGD